MGSRGKCRCPTGHHETPQRQKPSQTTGYARHLQVETPPMLTHQNTLNPRVQTDRSGTSIQFVQERLEGHPAMFATIEPVDVHVEQNQGRVLKELAHIRQQNEQIIEMLNAMVPRMPC
ncbi:uncharacterized protein [Dermacentor albipictus]|uniref:uncharacterized protein isoform X4 n=1 Tax=Dermacentor albipictus TaxID=60249 RepID=UPI0038FC98ED